MINSARNQYSGKISRIQSGVVQGELELPREQLFHLKVEVISVIKWRGSFSV
jgi:molybdopterin-binding protein